MSNFFQIVRYLFAGGLATGFNILILFICVHYFQIWYLASAVIAFCGGVILSYLLQKFFTFRNYSKERMHTQFLSFFIFALFMLGLNTLLVYIFVDIIGLWYLSAQFISSACIACINYVYFNMVIFKTT